MKRFKYSGEGSVDNGVYLHVQVNDETFIAKAIGEKYNESNYNYDDHWEDTIVQILNAKTGWDFFYTPQDNRGYWDVVDDEHIVEGAGGYYYLDELTSWEIADLRPKLIRDSLREDLLGE